MRKQFPKNQALRFDFFSYCFIMPPYRTDIVVRFQAIRLSGLIAMKVSNLAKSLDRIAITIWLKMSNDRLGKTTKLTVN